VSLVVAVDCSTTAAKAVVTEADGTVVGAGAAPLTTSSPHPAWHEQDARSWWEATREAVRAAVAASGRGAEVAAMCLTHQRESFVAADADGVPLRPAILWLDGRATAEIAELGSPRVHELSGKPPDTTPALYKIAWLTRREGAPARIGDVQAFLAWHLTGRWATSVESADTLGLHDLRRRDWSPELLALAGLEAAQLPETVPAGEPIGTLLPDVARDLGVPPVALVAGIGDGQAAGLALGATAPGVAYLNLGTSMVMGTSSDAYVTDRAYRTLAGVRGTYVLETVLNAAAYLAGWARDLVGLSVEEAEAAAAAVPPGAEGLLVLPYWNAVQTPYWDPLARGAVVGLHGRHTPGHLYRAVLEGVAFELALHLEKVEVTELRAVGGGARSPLWVQIVADAVQRPVRVCSAGEVSAAGAARLAHAFLDGGDPRDVPVPPGHDVAPQGDYADLLAVHRRLYPQLREVFAELAQVGSGSSRSGSRSAS
jgi:xylulokinase